MENISGGIAIEEQSANNLIDRNCLIGGYTGIRFYRFSTLNTVSENLVRDTYRGITVEFGCDYNQFMDNSIENNTVQGMSIESAEQQYICNNSFTSELASSSRLIAELIFSLSGSFPVISFNFSARSDSSLEKYSMSISRFSLGI